jgi:hypothetical protein
MTAVIPCDCSKFEQNLRSLAAYHGIIHPRMSLHWGAMIAMIARPPARIGRDLRRVGRKYRPICSQ